MCAHVCASRCMCTYHPLLVRVRGLINPEGLGSELETNKITEVECEIQSSMFDPVISIQTAHLLECPLCALSYNGTAIQA